MQLETDPNRRPKYLDFIDHYANLNDDEQARYRATYLNERGELESLAQALRLEGRQEGIPQGEAQILCRPLARRFGVLPECVEAKLSQASTDTLELWADRILDAESLEAVFQDELRSRGVRTRVME